MLKLSARSILKQFFQSESFQLSDVIINKKNIQFADAIDNKKRDSSTHKSVHHQKTQNQSRYNCNIHVQRHSSYI